MTDPPLLPPQTRPSSERRTLRFARWVVRRRTPLAVGLVGVTLFFAFPSLNAVLDALGQRLPGPVVRVDSRARDLFPDHPFIRAQDKFAGKFGNSTTVAIAVEVSKGTIFTPQTLARIDRITKSLDGWDYESHVEDRRALQIELEDRGLLSRGEIREELDRRYPPYPVNHDLVRGITHHTTRVVEMDPVGGVTGDYLMEELPETQDEADRVRARVRELIPWVYGRLVSRDERAALITAGFVTDRLDRREIFRAVFDHVQAIVERESDSEHRLFVVGVPILTGWILKDAWQIVVFVLLAAVTVFALLWLYFRRGHGVLIPVVCAIVTVIWGVGFTGWLAIPFDPLILVIPMIITARAVSHTVQMAERFFEDFESISAEHDDPEEAKREAAARAMSELIVPGTLGIITDVAGLLVIMLTTIPQMRNLGLFGAFWVASIAVTVEILHPILICLLPPPRESKHYVPRFMIRATRVLGIATTHPRGKWWIAGTAVALFAGSAFLTFTRSQIGEASAGTPLFWPDHPFNVAAAEISRRFGGADALIVYADGDRDNSAIDAAVLHQLESLDRTLEIESGAQGAVSLVPLVRSVNRGLRYGDPKFEEVPGGAGVRGLIFRIRTNAPPGALGQLLTNSGRATSMMVFYPDHRGETIRRAVSASERYIRAHPLGQVSVRLDENHGSPGAPWYDIERLEDLLYYTLGPLLPVRQHSLQVRIRVPGGYREVPVQSVAQVGLPGWFEDFRKAALATYRETRAHVRESEVFTWPDGLADWDGGDVEQWWDDPELGIRALSVDTRSLLVEDLRARDPEPQFQATGTWTRGVQLVMAGGVMGTLAAVNDEVERSHLANITLILFVIFVLHSLTYRSLASGGILLLQLATATLLSLAYMAVRGLGLNINTLPVQAVGVGIGVDYAIYVVDRIRQEVAANGGDIDLAIRRAIRTTGMAVTFTATTVVGGIIFWVFSTLRFQAEMAQLL
ncbi:MAG: RND family transporter, partial [Myxococcota bacterium]